MKDPLSKISLKTVFCALVVLVLAIPGRLFAADSTLDIANSLVENDYAGWTYGSNAADKKVDCVQFVLKVVETKLGQSLDSNIRQAILLSYGWTSDQTQVFAAAGTDPRLGGVVYAMTSLSHFGTVVQPSDSAPGDIIQYWMKTASGKWFGHSGVISRVHDGSVHIVGAHASPPPNGTIGESSFALNLSGADRLIYIVRL
jgi:hypothetical protein